MNLRVVLVEPAYDGNVGSVARAMKNFGFKDLVLVNPCPLEDFGFAMAAHAKDVLEGARVSSGLEEALSGADLVVGTTGKRLGERQRHLRLHLRSPCLTPAELAAKLKGREGEVALLLGRESWGLTNDELEVCDLVVSIPTSDEYPVMNISHAAAILLYELGCAEGGQARLASRHSLQLLQERARSILEHVGYPEHKIDWTMLMLRRILGRAELTEREVSTLMGVVKSINWRISARGAGCDKPDEE
jgi:tRNA/rRNA methyltransferase